MYHTILFDLDGTLTASGEGITKSVQYALARMGRPEPDLKKLELFIGPPLTEQFMQYAGYDYATAKRATGYFRERYETVGLFENKPFPGVDRLLQGLRDSGRTLCVASSKPEKFRAHHSAALRPGRLFCRNGRRPHGRNGFAQG